MITELQHLLSQLDKSVKEVLRRAGVAVDNDTLKVFIHNGAVKVTLPEYYKYVDSGRRKGSMPPINPIIDWIMDNKISIPNGMDKRQFAFAIANSIANKGIRPKPFIERMEELINKMVLDFVDNKVNSSLNNL